MEQLAALDAALTSEPPAELIADKGYHSRDTLKRLADGPWKMRVSPPIVPSGISFRLTATEAEHPLNPPNDTGNSARKAIAIQIH